MKSISAFVLQLAIALLGIGAFVFLLWEPHIEGRNAHATSFEIYFKDPFLAYVYVGSIPFFVALYRAFGLTRHLRENRVVSQPTVDALRSIKVCMMIFIGFVAGGAVLIIMFGDRDDRPVGAFMSLLVAIPSCIVAVAAARFARALQGALNEAEGRQ